MLLSQTQTSILLKSILLFGVGYVLYRGKPSINRQINGEETENDVVNVDDPSDKSVECSETTLQTIKPFKETKPVKSKTTTKEFDVIIIGEATGLSLSCAAWCEKVGLAYLLFKKTENVSFLPETYCVFPSKKLIFKNAKRISENDKNSGWIITVENLSNNSQKQYKCKHFITDPKIKMKEFKINMNKFSGVVIRSSQYTNCTALSLNNKRVLLVGWSKSVSEIASDLLEYDAKPTLLIRSGQVVIPQTIIKPIEDKIKCRLYYGNLSKYGITVHKKGLIAPFGENGIVPLMDVDTISAIKNGKINVVNSEIKQFHENGYDITFKNGTTHSFDAIVLAKAVGYQLENEGEKLMDFAAKTVKDNNINITSVSTFKQGGLQTLWYYFGSSIMIKIAAQIRKLR